MIELHLGGCKQNNQNAGEIKKLDDNSPKKTDAKDPKTIAKLVVDGKYSIPYMPKGIYDEIRDLVDSRDRIMKHHYPRM